ncbi:hypothetical protein FNV43_RR09157 [Rhamnella rubrinervis]|uniref:Growth-regulating factor n=1 Tax=Rhamnella rubrinervis TaxID=2594499 RepID=A0A8K0MJI0_9ROSA|nr:hypothetical protein FNV43_RR09157 [Rhamnella rubrinervis]
MDSQNLDSGIGPSTSRLCNGWNMKNGSWSVQEEEAAPVLGLNLELGRGHSDQKLDGIKCCGFTFLQLQELQLQALIYKYMEAGFPVPYHLLLPIWKSFAASLGILNGGVLSDYPSFLGNISPSYLEYSKKGMDREPWRCKRTDGKKWRCSKEAIPDHKYCERHVHRGRHRSKKVVVAEEHALISKTTTTSDGDVNVVGSNTNLSISLPRFGFTTDSSFVSEDYTRKTEPFF